MIDGNLPTPLYHQIYMLFRERILSGAYPQYATIPGEHEIARTYGVSRITAKRALDELAAEGLVSRSRGRGTRVVYSAKDGQVAGNREGLLENLLMLGLETEVRVLAFEYVPAPPETAAALRVAPGAIVQRVARVRSKEGRDFSYLVTYVPEDIGQSYTEHDLENIPLLILLERHGVKAARAHQTITATLADNVTGPALGIEPGAPLLQTVRVVFDQNDRPVQHITGYYRPDLYEISIRLTRGSESGVNTWLPQP